MKKFICVCIVFIAALLNGCTKEETLILATTTSTENSGLLDYVIPVFEEEYGIDVKVVAVGTGRALQMGRDGEADALLVHAKQSELEFMDGGYGINREEIMFNYFVLVGPKGNTINVSTVNEAFEYIYNNNLTFVSRGDDSGTHKKEKLIWENTELEPAGDWYYSVGKGMGDTLQMADELEGFTLSDIATYLSMKDNLDLEIYDLTDDVLLNVYSVILVNPELNENINHDNAKKFYDWISSEDTKDLISEFGKDEFGMSLFQSIE